MLVDLLQSLERFHQHIGTWAKEPASNRLVATGFVLVPEPVPQPLPVMHPAGHAEIHLHGAIGADFTFRATVRFPAGGDAHLQFRVNGDDRLGVSVQNTGFRIYRQVLKDTLVWEQLAAGSRTLAVDQPHQVSVVATGPTVTVAVGAESIAVSDITLQTTLPRTGRFGLYAIHPARRIQPGEAARDPTQLAPIEFSDVHVLVDTSAFSNFALVSSAGGYVAAGTKRALVRTLTKHPLGIDLIHSTFALLDTAHRTLATGPLTAESPTYGMQLWAADFSDVRQPGTYILRRTW